jgi:hypothetical protein
VSVARLGGSEIDGAPVIFRVAWFCGVCDAILAHPPHERIEDEPACPACGADALHIGVFHGTTLLNGTWRERRKRSGGERRTKHKHAWGYEAVSEIEQHHDSGRLQYVERVFDREHDRYYERITMFGTGEVAVTKPKQPLGQHQGYGSAKRRPSQ